MALPASNLTKEHNRIARFFAPLCASEVGAFGLQNDAAMLDVPEDKKLIITSDSCIEGWHVPMGASMQHIAQKLVRRNLSDVAAMGALPWRYMLNLHLPKSTNDEAVEAFAQALQEEQATYNMVLIGGDSTFGGDHIHATLTMLALTTSGCHMRSGARAGDRLYVTGTIGDATLALMAIQGAITPSAEQHDYFMSRYYTPAPRLEVGKALQGIATSVIDVSDGLMSDAEHLARASNVSMHIDTKRIPLSDAATRYKAQHIDAMLRGGDDYELLFTAPKDASESLAQLAKSHGAAITEIGIVIHASDKWVIAE